MAALTPANKANSNGSDWFELRISFVLNAQAQGKVIEKAWTWLRPNKGEDTVWVDDIRLERINGSLRNVAGGTNPPVITSSDGATVYREGVDYVVCPVGRSSAQ